MSSTIFWLFGGLIWLVFSLVVGDMASKRKMGMSGGIFISLFLSPVVAYIVILLTKDEQTDEFEKVMIKQFKKDSKE